MKIRKWLLIVFALVLLSCAGKTVSAAPVITVQPQDALIDAGTPATFTVEAVNAAHYEWQRFVRETQQWQFMGTTYDHPVLRLSGPTAEANGIRYRCVVKDAEGNSVISDEATLWIKACITRHPVNQFVPDGEDASFSVKAYGNELAYEWQFSRDKGETWGRWSSAPNIKVTAQASRNGYYFRCIVTDLFGNQAVSRSVGLFVQPVFTVQPQSQSACVGETVTLTAEAAGASDADLEYKWYFSKDSISWSRWGNGSSTSVAVTAGRNGYYFRCLVKNRLFPSQCAAWSDIVTLTVLPKITAQPASRSGKAGDTVTFSVTATGASLTYKWEYKKAGAEGGWHAWGSGKTATVEVKPGRNLYLFHCVVTDKNGRTLTSNTARLTVISEITAQPESKTAKAGDTVTFSVTAVGPCLTYQWQYSKDGGKTWGKWGTGRTAPVEAKTGRNGYLFRCMITDENEVVLTSDTVKLTVK